MKKELPLNLTRLIAKVKALCIVLILGVSSVFSQVPDSFNYQAVVRDNTGNIMNDQIVSVQLAVIQTSPNGLVKFIENHLTATNQFGLIKLNVGTGTSVNGEFSSIEWGDDLHFLRISIDVNGGNNFQFLGTTQLTSVPYAMYAKRVEYDLVDDADADPSNEIQELIIANDTLFISGGNYVVLPQSGNIDDTDEQQLSLSSDQLSISNGNSIDLSMYLDNTDSQSLELIGNTLSISNGNSITLTDNVDDADNDFSNELQELSIVGDTLFISNGNGVFIEDQVNDADSDVSNELQDLSMVGDTLFISNGNSVVIEDLVDDADSSPNNEIQFLTAEGDSIYITNGNFIVIDDDVDDADSDPLNELQEIFIAGNSISLSNANTAVDLSPFLDNTDSQNLSISNDSLFISGGNALDISSFGGGQFEASGSTVINGGDHATNDFVFGAPTLSQNGTSSHFAKMFFDKSKKGAFRTGYIETSGWNADSIGTSSLAAGYNTKALGEHSTAFGRDAVARGDNSLAIGNGVEAKGFSSMAFGFGSVAKMYYSFAGGNNAQANGVNSFAFGENALANGSNAVSIGKNVTSTTDGIAIGSNAQAPFTSGISLGTNNTSAKVGSISIGENAIAGGTRSVALGFNLQAPSYGEVVLGYNNTSYAAQSADLIDSNDRLFTIGNGLNALSPSDAFIIYKDGDAFLAGSVVTNSDKRLKKEIEPLNGSLEKVLSLNGYTYKWNALSPRDQRQRNTGLIAQEVEALFPEMVTEGPNGYKAVNYNALIPHLIESIKSQADQIDRLSRKISTQSEVIYNMNNQANLLNDLIERIGTLEQQLILGKE
ncbi:MAG: hypothetical protein HKN39_06935 [Flavobacteriales bacterium]|nr:hypothetical protein [Flavobacteriales bacterium]